VSVTGVGALTFTIVRAQDGTTGVAHPIGSAVKHAVSGQDFSDTQGHMAATTGHGATGAVVGTTNTQTLTNKTMSGASNTFTNLPGNTWTQIAAAATSGAAAFTISGLGGYKEIVVRATYSGSASSAVQLTLNGDTGSHYWNASLALDAAGVSTSTATAINIGSVTLTTQYALSLHLTGCDTTGMKHGKLMGTKRSVAGAEISNLYETFWDNTATLTSITFTLSSGTFNAGTYYQVYGRA
jgi:hypothetical protein